MFNKAKKIERSEFSFGISQLDDLVDHRSGILLFRTNSRKLAFEVGSMALLKNLTGNSREILLHLVDYHERYWTIDLDKILELSQRFGIEEEKVMENIEIIRAFSPSQMDSEENWDSIKDHAGKDTSLMVADSMEELYSSSYSRDYDSQDSLKKLVGSLHQISMLSDCPVLLFDYSTGKMNPFLSQVASTIVNVEVEDQGSVIKVLKGSEKNKNREKKLQWRK